MIELRQWRQPQFLQILVVLCRSLTEVLLNRNKLPLKLEPLDLLPEPEPLPEPDPLPEPEALAETEPPEMRSMVVIGSSARSDVSRRVRSGNVLHESRATAKTHANQPHPHRQ